MVRLVPPHELLSKIKEAGVDNPELPRGCVLMLERRARKLVEQAALAGFKGMSGRFLEKLARTEKVELANKTITGYLQALLQHIFPTMAQADIQDIIDQRLGSKLRSPSGAEEVSVLLQEGAVALAEDCLDPDEAEEVQNTANKVKRAVRFKRDTPAADAAPVEAASSSSSGAAASSSGAGPPPLPPRAATPPARPAAPAKVKFSGAWTPADAKSLLPPGATIHRDNVRFFRWQVTLDEIPVPPRSTSLVYGREEDPDRMLASLSHCYKWVWKQYLKLHPAKGPCPYDFDA